MTHFTISWDDELEWFLGIRFHWKWLDGKITKCHLSKEAFTLDLLDRTQLQDCNTSLTATPFRRGLPIDTITDGVDLTDPTIFCPTRTKYFQEIMGCLNWLNISTRPDLNTVITLLAPHQASPLSGHLAAALYVVRYLALASTLDCGITFSYSPDATLASFLHYPLLQDILTAFSGSNWGPMDASRHSPQAPPIERDPSSFHSIS